MNKTNIKRPLATVGYHVRVLLMGCLNVFAGTANIALLAVSIYGFIVVSRESGYAAVLEFMYSCFSLALSVASMYLMGLPVRIKRKGGRKYEQI